MMPQRQRSTIPAAPNGLPRRGPTLLSSWPRQTGRRPVIEEQTIQQVVSTLQLATAPTRMMILLLLGEREMFAGEIREALQSPSQPAVSHQLSLLRHGRLIEAQRTGRKVAYRLTDTGRLIVAAFEHLQV